MSQVEHRGATSAPLYEEPKVELVFEGDKVAKVKAGKNLGMTHAGTLQVYADRMEWHRGHGTVIPLTGVTSIEPGPHLFVRVNLHGDEGPDVAFLRHRVDEGENPAFEKLALLNRLQLAFKSTEAPPDEAAKALAALAEAASERTAAKMKRGRFHMLLGGGMFLLGLVITLVTYANAEPGGTYTLMWGAVLFGLLWFALGLGQYVSAARGRTTTAP